MTLNFYCDFFFLDHEFNIKSFIVLENPLWSYFLSSCILYTKICYLVYSTVILLCWGFSPFQNRDANDKNESLTALDALICNKSFLVTVIHTLEKQKNFSVKDRYVLILLYFAKHLSRHIKT